MKGKRKLWVFLFILIIMTPLGLWLPGLLGAGGAWGEWAPDELKKIVGYIPRGLEGLQNIWKAPLRDYEIGAWSPTLGYIVSGFLGVLIAVLAGYALGRVLTRKQKSK